MNKKDYKRVLKNIEPDAYFEQRLGQKLAEQGRPRPLVFHRRVMAPIAASLAVIACVGIFTFSNLRGGSPITSNPPAQTVADGAVFIPKIKLTKNTNDVMKMIGLIVYQGRIYTQTSSSISPEAAKSMLGDKIGRTKGTIDEWSSQQDYAKELASSIGEQDVYTVKGYDQDFRIMTYRIAKGQVSAEFYECLNGIQVSSGADVFQKLKIMGNVESASWESYASWNGGNKVVQPVPVNTTVQEFLKALYTVKPIETQKLLDQGIYEQRENSSKFVYLKLKDQSEVRLDLHQGGYVRYTPADVFFKLDDKTFAAMWESLK